MAISLRRPTLDEVNRAYTALMIGWGAVVGSVISFLLSGAMLWALVRLWQRRIRLVTHSDILWIATAFALYFAAEALSGIVHFQGSSTLYELAESLPFLGFLLPFSRLAISARADVLRSVEVGVLSGAFATLLYALLQLFVLGMPRAEGFAGNPGPFAVIVSVLYGLAVIMAVRPSGRHRLLAVLAMLASATALILSGMRALWPILILAPIIPFLVFRIRPRPATVGRSALAGVAAMMVIGFFTFDTIQDRLRMIEADYRNIVESQDYQNSLGYRLRLWRAGIDLVSERPVLGHGPGTERALSAERTAADGMPPISFGHFHNFVINTMVRSGLVGLAALVFMFATPLWIAARRERDEIADFGFTMILVVQAGYLLSGSLGIMLGHDILDALFIYGMITASFLVLGGQVQRKGTAP